jgi:hypothetical protein
VSADEVGTIYYARRGEIAVISPAGRTLRVLQVARPGLGFWASSMTIRGKQLFIEYSRVKDDDRAERLILIVNGQNGQVLERHVPSPELGNTIVCSRNDYTFFRVANGHVRFIQSHP